MKKHFAMFVFALLMLGVCVPPALAQSGSVKGVCKDESGNPIADGMVVWTNQDTGQKFPVKCKKGEYFSLGITPGTYTATLYMTQDDYKNNKERFHLSKIPVSLDERDVDFDLKKEQENVPAGMNPEQAKQAQESQEKQKKEGNTIKVLNEKIVAASTAEKTGDYDTAVATLTEASQIDATRDVIWGMLADAYRGSALKQTDPSEKTKRLQEAVADYQKAIDIKQKAIESATKKDPDDNKRLAGFYNNLGDAEGRLGKVDDGVKAYTQAAQVNPESAASYYYNAGAVLTNAGKSDEAIAMFDKCIAADPNKADAYYQKGVNLIGKATLQGDKMIAPAGTAEAFQKYLQVAPTGPYADVAKQMLASIGAPIETGFGKKKK